MPGKRMGAPIHSLAALICLLPVLLAGVDGVDGVDGDAQEHGDVAPFPPRGGPAVPRAPKGDPAARKASSVEGASPLPGPRRAEKPGDGVEETPEEEARADARIRELEDVLWREIQSLEERMLAIKERFAALTSGGIPPDPAPGVSGARPQRPAPIDDGEERRHRSLVALQNTLVERWRALERNAEGVRGTAGSARAREGTGSPDRDEPGKLARNAEREEVRSRLREVLAEILDIRERSRERQVRRLRVELEEIERALGVRHRTEERRVMIESRLREILEGGAGKRPEKR